MPFRDQSPPHLCSLGPDLVDDDFLGSRITLGNIISMSIHVPCLRSLPCQPMGGEHLADSIELTFILSCKLGLYCCLSALVIAPTLSSSFIDPHPTDPRRLIGSPPSYSAPVAIISQSRESQVHPAVSFRYTLIHSDGLAAPLRSIMPSYRFVMAS